MAKGERDYKTQSEIFGLVILVLLIAVISHSCDAHSAESKVEDLQSKVDQLEYEYSKEYYRGYDAGYDKGYDNGYSNGLDDGTELDNSELLDSYQEGYVDGYTEGYADALSK